MSSLYADSFLYILNKPESIVCFVTFARRFFHSSVIPISCSFDKLWGAVWDRAGTQAKFLQLFVHSETMQFAQQLMFSTPLSQQETDAQLSILRHLITNTRYFCRSLKQLKIDPICSAFELIAAPPPNNSEPIKQGSSSFSSLIALEELTLVAHQSSTGLVLAIDAATIASIFARIATLSNLRSVSSKIGLGSNNLFDRVTDEHLAPLSRLQHLASLNLPNMKSITGTGLAPLSYCKKLTTLHLQGCPLLNDEGLKDGLSKVTTLTCLSLSSSNSITDEGLEHVICELDLLRLLSITSCSLIHGGGLKGISRAIESLQLTDLPQLRTENCFESIASLPCLRYLDLTNCVGVDDEGLKLLAKKCSNVLESLVLRGSSITNEGLQFICQLTSLTCLHLNYNIVFSDESLSRIAKLTSLTNLHIENCELVTDLAVLKPLVHLTSFSCDNCSSSKTDSSLTWLFAQKVENKVDENNNNNDHPNSSTSNYFGHRLEVLSFTNWTALTDESLKAISRVTSLKKLHLKNAPLVTEEGLRELRLLKNLQYLFFMWCNDLELPLTDDVEKYLIEQIPGLQIDICW